MATIDETGEKLILKGPVRPPKVSVPLVVNQQKATEYEGLLEGIVDRFDSFDPSKGYSDPANKVVYDALWYSVFHSLTGEKATDCVSIWLFPPEEYLQRIRETFGDDETFAKCVGWKPMEIQGCNILGEWIILRDDMNLGLLVDMFHELGHRVYQLNSSRYQSELGANYFMLLAMKKVNTELKPHGVSIDIVDYGKQDPEEQERAHQEARRLIETNTPYVHQLK